MKVKHCLFLLTSFVLLVIVFANTVQWQIAREFIHLIIMAYGAIILYILLKIPNFKMAKAKLTENFEQLIDFTVYKVEQSNQYFIRDATGHREISHSEYLILIEHKQRILDANTKK